jgi:hypothetical protein
VTPDFDLQQVYFPEQRNAVAELDPIPHYIRCVALRGERYAVMLSLSAPSSFRHLRLIP